MFRFCHYKVAGNRGFQVTESLVQQGFSLMLYGMGVVFAFLTLLVIVTASMSHFVNRYFPLVEPEAPSRPPAANTGTPSAQDPQLIAVLSAAIREFKSRRKNK